MNRLLEDLNDAQREAVTHTEGPLLIIAGAGSGKTRVLTRRLAWLLTEHLAQPYQILAVTFTNKAAGEMKERVGSLMGSADQMNVSTFHSFCARLLRREATSLGYETNFTIFDAADSLTLVKNCLKDLGFSDTQFPPKGQLRKISDAKTKMVGPDQFASAASGYFESRTAELYTLYQKRLRDCQAMDFDDLLFNSVALLQNNDEIGSRYRSRFKYLMVDEYQDTNHIQYQLMKCLLDDHHNFCVVGDEDQSIYGWRGADIRNILEFETDFPGAAVIKLEQNYRSTQIILEVAGSVIDNNRMRKGKTLWTADEGGRKVHLLLVDSAAEEAAAVIERVEQERVGGSLKDIVILYRTNAQSRPFEEELSRRRLPYQIVGGLSFYQRKEIKDILAYLKLIVNPADDISFGRIINYPKRAIGNKTVATIAELAKRYSVSLYEITRKHAEYPELATKAAKLAPFVTLIENFRARKDSEPIDLITQDLVGELNLLEALLAEEAIIGKTRVDNVEAFIEGAAEYARTNAEARMENYLAEISLFTDLDKYAAIDDKVTMMTLHTAKGLEYNSVFIVGLEEGLFPLQRAITEPEELEEERRLFYVGATRARQKLTLATASSRFRFGQVMSMPSRFISEIPGKHIEKIDLRHTAQQVKDRHPRTTAAANSDNTVPVPQGYHYEYEDAEIMRTGRVVAHPTFGHGTIVRVDGFGESLRLEINFAGLGVKKILAKYARLKVVG